MGFDATCKDTVLPVAWLMWMRKTILTRVFLRPISVSPFLSSMSEFRSLRIPAQSILSDDTKSLNWRKRKRKHFWVSSFYEVDQTALRSIWTVIYMYKTSANSTEGSFTLASTSWRPESGCRHINNRLTPPLTDFSILYKHVGEIQTPLKQKTGNCNCQHNTSNKVFALAFNHFCKTVSSVVH